MGKKFIKNKEDFTCENCQTFVSGDGYTNHCPECLWSKHVDTNPGDRRAICGGMMEPIDIGKVGDEYILTHTCKKCSHMKRNKTAKNDSFDVVLSIQHSE